MKVKWNEMKMKSQLQDSNIEMHVTHNEGKSVVGEVFISRTLKNN